MTSREDNNATTTTSKSIVDRTVIPLLTVANNTTAIDNNIDSTTPSRRDGIGVETERNHRLYGTQLIWAATTLLKLNASTYATSCCIFHRFYHRVSLQKYCIWSVVLASLLLGSKIEDGKQQRTIREIIIVIDHIYRKRVRNTKQQQKKQRQQSNNKRQRLLLEQGQPQPQPQRQDDGDDDDDDDQKKVLPLNKLGPVWKEYYELILEMENRILRELGFTLYWIPDSHPHKFLWEFLKVLFGLKKQPEGNGDDDVENGGNKNSNTSTAGGGGGGEEEQKKLPQPQQDEAKEGKDCETHHRLHHEVLAQRAWNYCNDSCRLDLCVRYDPEVITCAAIHLAACDLGLSLPLEPKPWWELFIDTTKLDNDKRRDSSSSSSSSSSRGQDLSNAANAILGLQKEYNNSNSNNDNDNLPSSSSCYMEFLPSLIPGGSFNDEDSFLWESRT